MEKPPPVHGKEEVEDPRLTDDDDSVLRHWYSPPRETLENLLRTRIQIVEQQASDSHIDGGGTAVPTINWDVLLEPDCSATCNVHREVTHENDSCSSKMSFHGPAGVVDHLLFTYANSAGENRFIADMSTADPQTVSAFIENYARSRHQLGQNRVLDTLPGLFRALMVPLNHDNDQGEGAASERTHETGEPSSSQSSSKPDGEENVNPGPRPRDEPNSPGDAP